MNNYSNYRNKIKSGDMIAFTHKEWDSLYDLQVQTVRFFTQSEWSHVALVWRVSGRVFLIESVQPFIRIVPLSQFAEKGFAHIPLKTAMSNKELEFALSQVATGKYSKWQAIKAFFKALKIGIDSIWSCAEFIISCRKLSGLDLGTEATPSAVVQNALEKGFELVYVKGK